MGESLRKGTGFLTCSHWQIQSHFCNIKIMFLCILVAFIIVKILYTSWVTLGNDTYNNPHFEKMSFFFAE